MLELIHAIRATQGIPCHGGLYPHAVEKEVCWRMSDVPGASMDLIRGRRQAKKSFDCNRFNALLDKHLRT
jgi:hypothetical protein